ncbi:PAS domain S-box protein [Ramlibacter sp. PS3R-8]|uniref:PAS domain S-box protein n=1 Tax=Ramlibacter sp. PS3R-8 TaxID=3133437 RepID=UPI0030A9AF28
MTASTLLAGRATRFTMRSRLIAFALLCALPVFLLTVLQFVRETERSRDDAVHQMQDDADRLVRRLQQDLVSAETVAQAVGALDLAQPGAAEACSRALERAVAVAGTRVTNYIVISPAGDVQCSGKPLPRAINVADRPHVRQALQTGRPALSDFAVGRVSGVDNLQLVVPILGADKRVTAMAVAGLTAASLVPRLPHASHLPVTLALFDRAGVLVGRSIDNPSLRRGQTFAESELFANRQALARAPAQLRGLDGVSRLYIARPVIYQGETVLWATSGADVAALEASAATALRRDLFIVLLVALAVTGVAVLATRPLVLQPHQRELEHARRHARLGTWFRDNRSGRAEWSEETFELFGMDPALGAPGVGARELALAPGSVALMVDAHRKLLEEGKPFEIEVEVARPDRKDCWVVIRGEAVRDAFGRITGERGTVYESTERKLAAQAVQRSQHQLRSLMDGLAPSVFVALLTPEGVLVEVNRSPLDAAGLEAQDVLGQLFPDTPWWRRSEHARDQLRTAIGRAAQGEASRFELRAQGATDEEIVLDFSLQPLRDDTGQVIFLIPSAVVITERKRAETALRESESEFRALAESMPQIVWMTRPDGWNIYFNQRWGDYTGLTPQESRGHGWNKPFHPEDQQRAWDAWQEATAKGTTYMLESRLRRADGVYRWWLLRAVPQHDAAGVLVKWVGTCTDVHDLKLAELEISRANRELLQQQTELRVLFDLMPALIMFKDTENRILRINKRGAAAEGLRVDEIEGRSAFDIYPDAAREAHAADLEVIRTGQPQLGSIQKIRTRLGQEMWVQRDRVPYRDETGKVIGIVLMAQDVTGRKRDQDALQELNADLESRVRRRTAELNLARSQAEAASRAKSDFLASMSHEIRTPMSGLLGLLELLELSALDDDQHLTIGLARESGLSLLSIIDDILDFSKIEANRLDLNLVAGSVRDIVENITRLHGQVASGKNLTLHLDIDPQVSPLLAVDPLRLGQILNNFLSNAIKFTERGGIEVRVELLERSQETEHLRFVVQDTGVGMSAQQLERLFKPFVQADAAISAKFGGTGLGLVIARRLAELMGGSVEIASEPGRGTTLTLLLSLEICDVPVAALPAARSRRETLAALVEGRRRTPAPLEAEAEGTLVLLVDDHPTNRQVLLRQLASLGYAALTASDGVEGLALWRSRRFGAVITDCNMPRMNGYELAGEIRELERLAGSGRVPVIACTANALPAAVELCLAAGMDDYVVKPAALKEMSSKLARWLPLPEAVMAPAPSTAAAIHTPGAGGFIDLELLAEVSGGAVLVETEMLADFRRNNDRDAASLRAAAAAGDMAAVRTCSHRIKGAGLMLGATALAAACSRIEAASAGEEPHALAAAALGFENELMRLNSYLDGLARTSAGSRG